MGSSRTLVWFSCGDASAVAAKLAVACYENVEILYCDTFAYEHPDNRRFFDDVSRWLGKEIRILRSPDYTDIFDVFRRTRWLVGVKGARCTTELKKNVRKAYQRVDDRHVFGFTAEEAARVTRFREQNPEIDAAFPCVAMNYTRQDCHRIVREAGIDIPIMYRLGYRNNNCIGCVKGGAGYWNKIRRDFPDAFARMAKLERELGATINKVRGRRVFLDELPPDAGRYENENVGQCGVLCEEAVSNEH